MSNNTSGRSRTPSVGPLLCSMVVVSSCWSVVVSVCIYKLVFRK